MTRSNKIIRLLSWLSTFIVLITVVSGCSIVGLSVGALADVNNPDRADILINNIDHIKPGTRIEIVLNSDDTLRGKYKGIAQMSNEEYETLFNELSGSSNELSAIPAPSDTITIFDFSGNEWTYVLIGYNRGYLSVRRMEEEKPIAFLTRNISKIAFSNGEAISGADIESLIFERKLPVYQTLVLDSDGQRVAIPVDSITRVTRIGSNNRIWIGLALGFLIDLAIIIDFLSHPLPLT